MNDEFVRNNLELYGEAGKKWLDSIPQIIDTYQEKWKIRVFPPFNLSYNYVAPAFRNETPVVLKIGFPKDLEFQNEIEALNAFNGDGISKLIEKDKENAVILIEHVLPGIPLSMIEDDGEATRILAGVMRKIRKPLPKNHHFTTIFEWTKELREYPEQFKGTDNPPIPIDYAKRAMKIFEELISTSEPSVLVHADLHHDNILSSDRDSWLAIDPKGIEAEPAYETAAMIRNPYRKIKQSHNLKEFLTKRIEILSEELKLDSIRIQKWCFAQTVLSGVWTRNNADYTAHALRVSQTLENL